MKKIVLVCSCLFVATMLSCENQVEERNLIPEYPEDSSFDVPIAEAMEFAYGKHGWLDELAAKNARGILLGGKIRESKTVVDEKTKKSLFYIFNYVDGGFDIVSADYRSMPILAYSESGSINLDKMDNTNAWLCGSRGLRAKIVQIKKDVKEVHRLVEKQWAEYLASAKNLRSVNGCCDCEEWYTTGQYMCQGYSSETGPLLQVAWGQESLSNYYTPDDNACNKCHDNALAGCGPVAMAQVLRYMGRVYGNFGGYDFSAMPLSSYPYPSQCRAPIGAGEGQMAQLIASCGAAATTDYHFFSCGTLTLPSSIPGAMQAMGLSNGGSISSFNASTLRPEVQSGYPVIVKGKDNLTSQHIWVIDGYRLHEYSEYDCDVHYCITQAFAWYHMNWGWDGGSENGWYGVGNFSPSGSSSDYENNMKMIKGFRK